MVKQSFFNNKVLLISVLGLLFVHALAFQGWAAELKNYSLALENEFLRLYVRAETAEFAVEDIASGEVWYSATENINLERIKRGNARNNMRSLVVLNYFTPRREGKTLSSYGDSVLHEEFTVTIGPEQVVSILPWADSGESAAITQSLLPKIPLKHWWPGRSFDQEILWDRTAF